MASASYELIKATLPPNRWQPDVLYLAAMILAEMIIFGFIARKAGG
jgi:hypothetical protein